jgi:protein arginine N-methyltransferase 3
MERIRFVNYVRSSVKAGNVQPDVSSKELWSDDRYLQPVLEDDAVLYSLDDLDVADDSDSIKGPSTVAGELQGADSRLAELEEQLRRANQTIAAMKDMSLRIIESDTAGPDIAEASKSVEAPKDDDSHYFSSYAYNGKLLNKVC